jgi:hypothetical protein
MFTLFYLSVVMVFEITLSTVCRRGYLKYLKIFHRYHFRSLRKPRQLLFIPHGHRWEILKLQHLGAMSPSGRAYPSTYVIARCQGCGVRKHKVFYNSHLKVSQCRRWL